MRLTKKRAKAESLKVWGYLKDHPSVEFKYCLPCEIYKKIEYYQNRCPLCELFCETKCGKCPLNPIAPNRADFKVGCELSGAVYARWCYARTPRTRKKYATKIYNKILEWKV